MESDKESEKRSRSSITLKRACEARTAVIFSGNRWRAGNQQRPAALRLAGGTARGCAALIGTVKDSMDESGGKPSCRSGGERARRRAESAAGQQSQSSPSGKDEKFQAAKRAFARLYHPDNIKAEGFDKIFRAEIFKEYWRELETIEKSAKR